MAQMRFSLPAPPQEGLRACPHQATPQTLRAVVHHFARLTTSLTCEKTALRFESSRFKNDGLPRQARDIHKDTSREEEEEAEAEEEEEEEDEEEEEEGPTWPLANTSLGISACGTGMVRSFFAAASFLRKTPCVLNFFAILSRACLND